jgi:hypothetical protein
MASGVEISGLKEAEKALESKKLYADIAARNWVTKGALIVEANAKRHFRGRPTGSQRTSKKTGRTYYIGAPRYPASPPDPTNRTGNLYASIKSGRPIKTSTGWSNTSGTELKYAPFVNYGTSRARPFPFMDNGLKDSIEPLRALADAEWAAAMER